MKISRHTALLVPLLLLLLQLSACSSSIEPYAEYKPQLLPIKIIIKPSGITTEGDASIITPLGMFSIGAEYQLERLNNTTLIIIRNRNNGSDTAYRIQNENESLAIITNGKTIIQATNQEVLIDITEGNVEQIEFTTGTKEEMDFITENPVTDWITSYEEKYNALTPFRYTPFALTRWAYDDSTISKWYGLGFILFLIRVICAVIMIVPDIFLSIFIWPAGGIAMFFGVTARNIYLALLSFFVLIGVILMFNISDEATGSIGCSIIIAITVGLVFLINYLQLILE